MTLHPKLRERIDHETEAFPDLTQLPVNEGRAVVRDMERETDRLAGPPPPLESVEDHLVPLLSHKLKVRLYFPKGTASSRPVLEYLHGGGWVFGDLDTHDSFCREISARSGVALASVDYRRSPEDRFPAALEDGYAAMQWLANPETARRFNFQPGEIAIGGDSAGGNMAAVLSAMTRDDHGPPLAGQILLCPVTGYYPNTPSYAANGTGFGLDASFIAWMWTQYLSTPKQGHDPRVAPLLAPNLSHVAPALVITAEYDLLRDEGELYAARLQEAGVPTQMTRYNGMVHGFQDYRGIVPEGWAVIDEVARTLKRWFKLR